MYKSQQLADGHTTHLAGPSCSFYSADIKAFEPVIQHRDKKLRWGRYPIAYRGGFSQKNSLLRSKEFFQVNNLPAGGRIPYFPAGR